MRVFVVRNGHMGGGKHLVFDAGAGLQALIKSAGETLGLQFACLLYTPQGGLVDGIWARMVLASLRCLFQTSTRSLLMMSSMSAKVRTLTLLACVTVLIGEDFKNPSMAAGPAPVTLKNMFDESRAHLPAPTPLRKSVEQRLGLKTSTGGVRTLCVCMGWLTPSQKSKADYEAAVLQVSEVFPTYELNVRPSHPPHSPLMCSAR